MRQRRFLAGTVLLVAAAFVTQSCNQPAPVEAPATRAAAPASDMTAVVSVRELMTNLVDPLSDNIFDAVGSDVTPKGIVETKPTTDEDWAKIRQGAIVLAESANLLKIPREAAPAHDYVSKNPGDREAVLKDRSSRAYTEPVKK
jgi:hypothetical protein